MTRAEKKFYLNKEERRKGLTIAFSGCKWGRSNKLTPDHDDSKKVPTWMRWLLGQKFGASVVGVFSVFWLLWSGKHFFCFVLFWDFGKNCCPCWIFFFPIKPAFMQQWMRWWQSTLCGRKTALLIRILGSKFKTVSLLFGELYMIQLILPVQTQSLTRCVIETHTHTNS